METNCFCEFSGVISYDETGCAVPSDESILILCRVKDSGLSDFEAPGLSTVVVV